MKTQCGSDLTGKEMAEMLDEFANANDKHKFKAFAEQVTQRTHRTLQQGIMRLFIGCLEMWAEKSTNPNHYDARNEATVKMAAKMIAATGDKYDRHLPLI